MNEDELAALAANNNRTRNEEVNLHNVNVGADTLIVNASILDTLFGFYPPSHTCLHKAKERRGRVSAVALAKADNASAGRLIKNFPSIHVFQAHLSDLTIYHFTLFKKAVKFFD